MQKILFLILFSILVLFSSCIKHTKEKSNNESENKEEIVHDMRTLLMTPDSLRSEENRILLSQLEAVVYDKCIINNGKLELTISREEWRNIGLQEEFYDMLQSEVNDINNYMDTTSFPKQLILDSYEKAQKEFYERNNSHITE